MEEIYQQIKDLTVFGQRIGSDIAYFQGGGGNISCKIYINNKVIMAVKASGFRVRDIALVDGYIGYASKGLVILEYSKLTDILGQQSLEGLTDGACVELLKNARIPASKFSETTNKLHDPAKLLSLVSQCVTTETVVGASKTSENKIYTSGYDSLDLGTMHESSDVVELSPSMETWFHALLPGRYVMHSHSVYVNVLTCSHQGEAWILENLKPAIAKNFTIDPNNILWLDYVTPGIKVAAKIKKQLGISDLVQKTSEKDASHIIFLANHGVIVSGRDSAVVMAIHEYINSRIRNLLCLAEFSMSGNWSQNYHEDSYANILIPDLAVYKQNPQSDNFSETYVGHCYVLDSIEAIGFTPRYLSTSDVAELLCMESEKYRSARCSTHS